MSRTISEEWLSSLPSQFRPERIVKEELCFFECDSYDEVIRLQSCSVGSAAIVRGEHPVMYMKSTTTWVRQSAPADEGEVTSEDGI